MAPRAISTRAARRGAEVSWAMGESAPRGASELELPGGLGGLRGCGLLRGCWAAAGCEGVACFGAAGPRRAARVWLASGLLGLGGLRGCGLLRSSAARPSLSGDLREVPWSSGKPNKNSSTSGLWGVWESGAPDEATSVTARRARAGFPSKLGTGGATAGATLPIGIARPAVVPAVPGLRHSPQAAGPPFLPYPT